MNRASKHIHGAPIVAGRVRHIGPDGFSFFPNRFVHDGFFAALSTEELLVYVLLVLVSDRRGISLWGHEALCALLRMPLERYLIARNGLIDKDLVALDGRRIQVLALPAQPPAPLAALVEPEQFEQHDPATIGQLIHSSLKAQR